MVYLLSGTDHFRLQERVREIEQDFLTRVQEGKKLVFDIEDGWGEEERSFLVSALSPGLFSTPYCIVVRGIELLDDKAGAWLVNTLTGCDAMMVVVLVARLEGRKKLPTWCSDLKRSVSKIQQEVFGAPTPQERDALLDKHLHALSVTLEPRAKALLLQAFPENVGELLQTTTRLALSVTGTKITATQVEESVTPSMESVTFAALDALAQGNRARAIALFHREAKESDALFALLGLCGWQVRRLIMVKELYEEGRGAADIARELKTSPYPIQKTLPLLPKLSFGRLRQALTMLADFDQAIKTGRMQPGVALDLFVWKF